MNGSNNFFRLIILTSILISCFAGLLFHLSSGYFTAIGIGFNGVILGSIIPYPYYHNICVNYGTPEGACKSVGSLIHFSDECETSADCKLGGSYGSGTTVVLPTPPVSKNTCDTSTGKCSPDGNSGAVCTSDAACEYVGVCDSLKRCIRGSGGATCIMFNNKCRDLVPSCNIYKGCSIGGETGIPCKDDSCRRITTSCSDSFPSQCVIGGGGGPCINSDDCKIQIRRCNSQKQCVPGGSGDRCVNNISCGGAL